MCEIIKALNLVKTYQRGSEVVHAIDKVNFCLNKGDFIAVTGPSGSGKTTLINLLGALDNPSQGDIYINDKLIFNNNIKLSENQLSKIRRENFGYIFQKFFLIPTLTVEENIFLPHTFFKKPEINNNKFIEILDFLGITHRLKHLPGQLSGGEMQRTAIARALVNNPHILIADEPTGNLDSKKSMEIGDLLCKLNKELKISIILVTHNNDLAKKADINIEIHDGKILKGE